MRQESEKSSLTYSSYEDFLFRHPNPMRQPTEESASEDILYGNRLAREFLRELTERIERSRSRKR